MINRTLWVFGQSHCLPYSLKNRKDGWDRQLAYQLDCRLRNFAEPAADNLFIFSSLLGQIKKIKHNDVIVIGWSHPSRKSFILDDARANELYKDSMVYNAIGNKFYRSKGKTHHTFKKWFTMKPKQSGIKYYDSWFKDYYNIKEQKINFIGYLTAVENLLEGRKYIPFYFSKDSVKGVAKVPKDMCMAEFVASKNVAISKEDVHMNEKGHLLWSEKLFKLANQ